MTTHKANDGIPKGSTHLRAWDNVEIYIKCVNIVVYVWEDCIRGVAPHWALTDKITQEYIANNPEYYERLQ